MAEILIAGETDDDGLDSATAEMIAAAKGLSGEVAVALFLENRLGFSGIPRLIEAVLSRHSPTPDPTLEQIMEADTWARQIAEEEASR